MVYLRLCTLTSYICLGPLCVLSHPSEACLVLDLPVLGISIISVACLGFCSGLNATSRSVVTNFSIIIYRLYSNGALVPIIDACICFSTIYRLYSNGAVVPVSTPIIDACISLGFWLVFFGLSLGSLACDAFGCAFSFVVLSIASFVFVVSMSSFLGRTFCFQSIVSCRSHPCVNVSWEFLFLIVRIRRKHVSFAFVVKCNMSWTFRSHPSLTCLASSRFFLVHLSSYRWNPS